MNSKIIQKQTLVSIGLIAMISFLAGCNSKNSSLSNYKSVGINMVSIDTTLSYGDAEGIIPNHPPAQGDPVLKETEKQFLIESANGVIGQIVQNPNYKIVLENLATSNVLNPSNSPLDSEKAKKLCEKLQVDAVADINFGYFYSNRPTNSLENVANIFHNVSIIASGKAGKRADSIGMAMHVRIFDKTGKNVLNTSLFAVSKKLPEFTMPAHTFHLYADLEEGFKDSTQKLTNGIEVFYKEGVSWIY